MKDKGCLCHHSLEQWNQIIKFYGGNSLLLKFLATTIQNVFDGVLSDFLAHNTPIFGEIRSILAQQFQPLDNEQKTILFQLALNEQPIGFSQLREQILPSVSPQNLLESLDYLKERSLIEQSGSFFFLTPVLKTYLIEQLSQSKINEASLKTWSLSSPLQFTFAAS